MTCARVSTTLRRAKASREAACYRSLDTNRGLGWLAPFLLLCFHETGNKFVGDTSDTNLVKIYLMPDCSQSHQYNYYQPGIGAYITSHSLGSKGRLERIKSSYKGAKDAALGSHSTSTS
ncbi:hypothetical protein N7532_011192 [Penicillium argentinense]|uniref:T6SS Phospholipase effector Tle1-like catalytic domain-containing protein n=1 Tax=Penicillium argentinense TaxID=1131581 RepID=A0A9W9EI05_9EURO|nr:uncharacterized protein N7532_011192 [Penicillium argentinense]KAJ5082149.1 hypothetical protein N7532_011192 [Penicillium argentinense]